MADISKKQKSRTVMASKNVMFSYFNHIATTILKFICRWAFIRTIGVTYLGVNGLYTNILGVLSLTELGISTAMNYSLYKPVAEGNIEKIKSLMRAYKIAYRIIALVVSVIGLAIVPFLNILIKDAKGLNNKELVLYYLLFLFNTVISYFVSYKYSLNSAEQKGYLISNITTISTILMNIVQIIVLFVFKSFLGYLLVQIVFGVLIKVFNYFYLDHLYPYLKDKNVKPLDQETKKSLFVNIKALMVHKLGQVAVNQTDNLIISSVINVTSVGLISNYTLITGTVDTFLNIIFNNITSSLGNLIATTNKDYQYKIYKIYDFIDFWMYGFSAIAYASLIQAFTSLMWGAEYVVDFKVILLIIINTYIVGQRIPLNNMKVAGGVFNQDRYLPAIQAVLNLGISIILAKQLGLIGVYLGTIISGVIPTFVRPLIIYKPLFNRKPLEFYILFFKHFLVIVAIGFVNYIITDKIMTNLNWLTFGISAIITAILPNVILMLIYFRSEEFKYILGIVKKLGGRFKK